MLLGQDIRIVKMLESESNKDSAADKFNRVDMLAVDSEGVLIIIEVQNIRGFDYFLGMIYGASKP